MRSRDYGRREIEVLRGEIERGTVIIKKKKKRIFFFMMKRSMALIWTAYAHSLG